MPNNLSGQFDLLTATEGMPVSNDIASFTDDTPGDTAADFTVTIDWGDNITTTGTVVGSAGSFTVQGSHTYADDGLYSPVVTVTRTTDNIQLVLQSPGVTVGFGSGDVLTGQGQPAIVSNATTLTNVVVATFTDPYLGSGVNDYFTTIDWGDGNVTAGTLTLGNDNVYTVTGSHAYATGGQFTITAFMSDDNPGDNAPFAFAQTAADLGYGGSEVLSGAIETIAVPVGTKVATFVDNTASLPASDYSAQIDWGDGTTTPGTVSAGSVAGTFTVTSAVAHTYADEGLYTETVTVTRSTDSAQIALSGTVAVEDTDVLSGSATTVTGSPSVTLNNVTVANFGDSNTTNSAGDFVATIDWGDGSNSTGTVSGSGGSFSVTDSHTYAQNGQYIITVGIGEDPADGQATAVATVESTALIGLAAATTTTINATEGTPTAANQRLATFSDSTTSDVAADFTASIDWGDGTTTNGTVTGGNGSFTVTGGSHTYADEGGEPVSTTLTRTADGSIATAFGTANVADADVLALTAAGISGNAGQAFNNVQLATFTDAYTGNSASDFTATIDWGDGTDPTFGTITGSGGSFTVDGSHTYTNGGNDTFTVTVADDFPGTASAAGSATASINFGGQMVLTSATEGTALPGNTPIATFTDNDLSDTASSFSAQIDWGDGTTTPGTVVGLPGGPFTVEGGHTYADEGTDPAVVTLTRNSDQASPSVSGFVTVAEGDSLTPQGTSISVGATGPFSGVVATFADSDTVTAADDFSATINWDDGTTTAGTVTGSNGSFTVSGSHTYTTPGEVFAKVTLADDDPGTATATATTTVTITDLAGQMALNSATESVTLPAATPVATFSDSNDSDTAAGFTAEINWGDGATTTGTVVGGSGSFTVEGGHTYADEGSDPASVTFTRTSDNVSATASGTITVGEDDVLAGQGTSFALKTNQAFSGTVATFTDTDTANVASDFGATVDWGDGTTTSGTISGSNGSYTVSGSHTYTAPGPYTVTTTFADDAPGTATATATTTATVRTLSGVMALTNAKEGTALPNTTTVAVFTDSDSADTANQFTASINWGDSSTTAGTVVGSNGIFLVEGGHIYADEGSDTATVTLTHNPDGTQGTTSGPVAVAEGDVLTGNGLHIKPKAGQVFSGTVATFSDVDTVTAAGDFSATINWGDGTTTTGTVSGGNGSFTVNGSHTYAHPGDERMTVTLVDDAPGTATAIANTNATVSNGGNGDFVAGGASDLLFQNAAGNANVMIASLDGTSSTVIPTPVGWNVVAAADFNQNGNSDIVLQNNDGLPEIWLMNGASVTSTVTLPNPGASWHVIAAADFTGSGNPDLLWQNNDGAAAIWEMNGASLASGAMLPDPGPTWHAIGAGDFNGDGNADILWQNSDGAVAIWEMNGSSIIGAAVVANPGPTWHAIGAGDFNGDGNADIVFQNNDGLPAIWEMNGTAIVGAGVLPNPGTTWHAMGTGDNGDILWQNADGTPAVWQMNGFSIATASVLPNPGATWQLKDDGPIQSSSSQQPALVLSSPDAASSVLQQSAPDTSVSAAPPSTPVTSLVNGSTQNNAPHLLISSMGA